MEQNFNNKPLSFTVSEIKDETVISGGIVNSASRFENDDDLMDIAYQYHDALAFRVEYTAYVWNVGEGDVDSPSREELKMIRSLYDRYDDFLFDNMDFVESGCYEVDNPFGDEE